MTALRAHKSGHTPFPSCTAGEPRYVPVMINSTLHPALKTPIDNNVDGKEVNANRLLADLLQCNHSLVEIALEHKLTVIQLVAWADQPGVRSLIDAVDELANRVANHKAAHGRQAAIQLLTGHASGLCETPRDRELASRAARSLVRIKPIEAKSQAASDSEPSAPLRRRRSRVPVPTSPETGDRRLCFAVLPFRPEAPSSESSPPAPPPRPDTLHHGDFKSQLSTNGNGHYPPAPNPPGP